MGITVEVAVTCRFMVELESSEYLPRLEREVGNSGAWPASVTVEDFELAACGDDAEVEILDVATT